MKTIALVIGQTRSGNPSPGHFGDSECFVRYALDTKGRLFQESERDNTSREADESHGAKGKMKQILSELAPVDCLVAGAMSPNFKRMALQASVQPVVVKATDNARLTDCLRNESARLFELVSRRRQGERNPDVPVLCVQRKPPRTS